MTHYFITKEQFETMKVYENDKVYKAFEKAMVAQLGEVIGKRILEKFMEKTIQQMTAQSGVDLMSAIRILG